MAAETNKVVRYLSAFFGSEALMFLGSFISFPLFTRIFSKNDYGIMSLIAVTIALVGHLSGLGLKDAVLRFYSLYPDDEKRLFVSTILNASVLVSLIAIGLLVTLVLLFNDLLHIGHYGVGLALLASSLILFRGIFGVVSAIFRIEEKVREVIFFDFFQRYGGLLLSVFLVMIYRNLLGYYWGLVIAEAILALLMIFLVRRDIAIGRIRGDYLRASIRYGFPLSMSNIATFFLNSGDRYVVGLFLGPAAVATYSVAYNLCNYIFELVKNIFFKTFMPIVINHWNKANLEQSQDILSLHFRLYLLVSLPAVSGLSAVGADALKLLAGAKYQDAFFLVPILASAIAVNGLSHVTFAGMYFKSQSRKILMITLGTAVMNLVLNFLLLPLIGMSGAAWATGTSYLVMVGAGYLMTRTTLKIDYQFFAVMKYILFSGIVFVAIRMVPRPGNLGLMVKIALGVIIYVLLLMLFDRKFLRREVLDFHEIQDEN